MIESYKFLQIYAKTIKKVATISLHPHQNHQKDGLVMIEEDDR